jgi:formylglycine-generating enzyme required for sulfatase activity
MSVRATRRRAILVCILIAPVAALGCGNAPEPTGTVIPPASFTTKSGIEMVYIQAGSFKMGSTHGRDDERPVHQVQVGIFLMDRYEVTQAEYEKLGRADNPPFANPSRFKGPDLPVEQVTWPQAARFCNARSRLEGLRPCYDEKTGGCNFDANGYRLPTEAEWEYACRGLTLTDRFFGDDLRRLGEFAWFADNSGQKTHPVGQKKPNPFGLYDMYGNVAEWCQDVYDKDYYRVSPRANPRGPAEGPKYVLRGGSWKSSADALRTSARLAETPGFSDACLARDAIGFRCVRRPPLEEPK